MSNGVERIAMERVRQVAREGYDASHDDTHVGGEMATCAAIYALPSRYREYIEHDNDEGKAPRFWPFDCCDWKPGDRIRELEKAGALIAAEIDRLLRQRAGESRPASTGWRPIISAPKDGTEILVLGSDGGLYPAAWRFDDERKAGWYDTNFLDWHDGEPLVGLAYWMPTPRPASTAPAAEKGT